MARRKHAPADSRNLHAAWTHALTAVLAAAAAATTSYFAAASTPLSTVVPATPAVPATPVVEPGREPAVEPATPRESPRYAEHLGSYSQYVIIGAGPGGMQLGAFMEAGGIDYRIVERGARVGTFWETYPRHGTLISLNKRFTSRSSDEYDEFNWRHDWNSLLPASASAPGSPRFTSFSRLMFPAREDYLSYLQAYYRFHRLKVQFDWDVVRISRHAIGPHHRDGFSLHSSAGRQITCKYLVVATALERPLVPNMEGIELAEGYESVDVREEAYEDQRVLVLGLGNAAFEAANRAQGTAGYVHMIGRSHGGLKQSYFTHYVGDLRAVNNGVLDTFFLKSLDTIDVETDLEKANCSLRRSELGGKAEISFGCGGGTNPSYREGYDRVIRCLGWVFEDRLFDEDVKPTLNRDLGRLGGKYPALKDSYESANVNNLFFAGTLSHAHDYKKSAGGFVHGFRYTARALYRMLRLNHHGVRWEAQSELDSSARAVALAMQRRFQSSSGLYQMFGELCDAVLVSQHDAATYMEEVPLRFISNSAFPGTLRVLFTMHMDYGNKGHNGKGDLSFATREVGRAHYSQFLHPIMRAYLPSAAGGLPALVSEFHILEDLLTTWDVDELHLQPLVEWISRVYARDYTTQEELLASRFKELEMNLTREERSTGSRKFDEYFGSFTFPPAAKDAMKMQ